VLDNAGKELGIKPLAHIEINTGMGRCGFDMDKIDEILTLKNYDIRFCGTFTHFSFSFANKPCFVEQQRKKFVKAVEFLNVIVWGKTAENCVKYLNKGSKISVVGKVQTRKWEDEKGNTKFAVEVVAQEIEYLSVKKKEEKREEFEPIDDPDGQLPF
jgi:hypothetical protein